jgi:N-acetylmuramoyl-L-alanine amidase
MLASPSMHTAALPAQPHWLPYCHLLQERPLSAIDLVVIHCTELPDLAGARAFGEQVLYPSGTGNSGHFYIDRDGAIAQYVPLKRVAHHVRGYNGNSVGIELVNRGRWPDWYAAAHQQMDQAYTTAQLDALASLLEALRQQLPGLAHIAGHEDLDSEQVPASDDPTRLIARKRDPGPLFPWPQVLARTPLQRLMAAG